MPYGIAIWKKRELVPKSASETISLSRSSLRSAFYFTSIQIRHGCRNTHTHTHMIDFSMFRDMCFQIFEYVFLIRFLYFRFRFDSIFPILNSTMESFSDFFSSMRTRTPDESLSAFNVLWNCEGWACAGILHAEVLRKRQDNTRGMTRMTQCAMWSQIKQPTKTKHSDSALTSMPIRYTMKKVTVTT